MHIVEKLIAERAPQIVGRPRLFKLLRPLLYRMLAYDAAVFLADSIKPLSGHKAFKRITDHISSRTAVQGLSNLPSSGGCVIIANHPTGLADAMAIFQAIRDRRPRHCYLANADALRLIPNGEDIIIPVEWMRGKRNHTKTRETLVQMKKALQDDRCVIIFPSGRLAHLTWKGLTERPWESSAAMIAKKYKVPIIPLNIKARNSILFYVFATLNSELRDITLFHELLNKKGKTFRLTFGEAISPAALSKNAEEATAHIREIVQALGR